MNKIDKITYFFLTPFTQRDYERFGIGVFLENEFRVEIWDFTSILNPKYLKHEDVDDVSDFAGIKRFDCKKKAMKAIENLSNDCFVINHLGLSCETYSFFKAVSQQNIPYGILEINKLPPADHHQRKRSFWMLFDHNSVDIMGLIKRKILEKIDHYLFKQPYMIRPGFKPATLLITAGRKTPPCRDARVGKETKTVKAHALDYDTYLRLRETDSGNDTNIAVFLDEYEPFHPDYTLENMEPPATPEIYYPLLCKFFDHVEEKLELKVVVAAHPRSQYEKHPDYFADREIVYGKTARLIKDCRLVLLHTSTAINFAVLFNKPLLFIITDELKIEYESLIQAMRRYLGASLIDLDASVEFNMKTVYSINKGAYRRYKADFIKEPFTPEKNFSEILIDQIKDLQ